jgi:hypothetical protein
MVDSEQLLIVRKNNKYKRWSLRTVRRSKAATTVTSHYYGHVTVYRETVQQDIRGGLSAVQTEVLCYRFKQQQNGDRPVATIRKYELC